MALVFALAFFGVVARAVLMFAWPLHRGVFRHGRYVTAFANGGAIAGGISAGLAVGNVVLAAVAGVVCAALIVDYAARSYAATVAS